MEHIASLKALFESQEQVRTDTEALTTYGQDWTKHLTPKPSAVVFPKTTQEVQNLVLWARKHHVALVPSGGRTGLSGAAVALNNEVLVSFEKMNQILEFDAFDQTVTCEPGVITEHLQNYALDKGLYFPVDFASRGSSQIGGNIATNAGGIKVLRYGLIRNWVTGLEVVTGRGEVLKLNKSLVKNATGYDLRQLFIGSEGTLGFITQATLGLTRQPEAPSLLLLSVSDLNAVMSIYHSFKTQCSLSAFEMFTDKCLDYVIKHSSLPAPFADRSPYYVLVEIDGQHSLDRVMSLFEQGMESGWISDGAISQSAQQFKDFWRYREDISEATSHYQPYKNDISVRISRVPSFLEKMQGILDKEYPGFEVCWFGHIGDGNLHINILKPQTMDSSDFIKKCHEVDRLLFDMIEHFEGSVSAEHGVGITKKPYLHHTRSSIEIELMKSIKAAFDPDNILNPGKIFS